jgi:medium-chain acyl-[acyl-carrier-protein] hydrolase
MPLASAREPANPWIELRQASPAAALNLFCFPHAGGSAWQYRQWQALLPPQIEVVPIQYSGRGRRMREPFCTNMQELVEGAARGLASEFERRPFAFFGHSMGAIAAFELARLLQRERWRSPELVFVAGTSPPSRRRERREIWKLPDAEFAVELRVMNGTPEELLTDPEAMALLMPLIRRDLEIADSYCGDPRVRIGCNLVAMGGTNDPDVPIENIEAWKIHCLGSFRAFTLEGDHFFVNQNPQVLQIVAECLAEIVPSFRREGSAHSPHHVST